MNLNELNTPFVILMSGVPMSGKSTWIKNNTNGVDVRIISRDSILLETYGSDNYSEAYNNVDQKLVDKILLKTILDANSNRDNVILDMTNLSVKVRRRNLSYFSDDYTKIAIAFPVLSKDEYDVRNNFRRVNENKYIPNGVLSTMINSYVVPTYDEGFDEIIKL